MNAKIEALLAALSEPLAERCRLLSTAAPSTQAKYVLYWMHHAVRGHENPALDVAVALANQVDLPVLVYQGLGGRHPYDNDRHHTFILQGARDAHRELESRGIRAAFHLDATGRRRSPLQALCRDAALFVVEDYPVPPFTAWTARLVRRTTLPVIAVDASCLVPMRLQPRRFSRAYEFRRHNQAAFAQRVPRSWSLVEPDVPLFDGDVGFAPLDLDSADIAELCAGCTIDHAVAPVAHTPGGSRAGYRRWERFRSEGLARYDRERNDAALAWPRGVSRLSAYLHHGHVSPFRIAREAWETGGAGAEKFLDELLVWRELAFNFCFFTPDPERIEALPEWAQQTLAAHAGDPRPTLLDNERLARSRSGDALWDLAQTALRIHGELHNNLRMTWAKAIPPWRPTPQAALDSLIELNHRYALDGSDPNSYGGLLWTLGLFDRPFPDAPVVGRLRGRSTAAHARRLDLEVYRERVNRPSTGAALRVAVIGAGIAGLSAARVLHDHGHAVQVFEKSRGRGGRAATRRIEDLAFDHGAQYFTVRDPAFRRAVEAWRERGLVAPWPRRLGRVSEGGDIEAVRDGEERFVALPGMSALGRHLAADLELRAAVQVAPPRREQGRWRLASETGEELGAFDALIVAAPAPQTRALLEATAPALAARAAAVTYEPTWAVMLAIAEPSAMIAHDALRFDHGPLRWAANDSGKPGRHSPENIALWVLQASHDWTREHLEATPETVAAALTAAFCRARRCEPAAVRSQAAHRWLYALAANPLGAGALWDAERMLGACGDWCLGARLEAAYLSGQAMAGRLLGHLRTAAMPD